MTKRTRQPVAHPELGLPEVRKNWQTEGLFSDHYLRARIQQNAWWPTDDQTRPVWRFCKELYEKRYIACARNNEAFTRQELLDKVLERLGFAFTDNLTLPETQQDLEPDYLLYASPGDKERVLAESKITRYRASVALLEAKKLKHPLSQLSRHQQRYPHQQIRDYLAEAEILSWGILTNGNEWRLYCRDAKPSQFFALNLEWAILSLDNFKYFFALFGPQAFVREASGRCRLDAVRESALTAQSELEDDLRRRVFGIVEILANGFRDWPENRITDTDLPCLYRVCLILLYRLLFILYAEGRQLLPVEPKSRRYYKDLSLARLVTPLKAFLDFDSRTRTRLCEDVLELCHLINGSEPRKNAEYSVPLYNGGLFDPARSPELERWRVSDAVLAEVLRGLMFSPLPEPRQPSLPVETVDYADLRVQQLGSIYEGLLEHHFVREGERLALRSDRAERKATGTYYTPDYIVKYIVENTVGPLLAEIAEREPVKAALAAGGKDNSFADAVIELNLCDPAMGSGHFLVEVTTYLAEQLVYHPTTKLQAEFTKGESQEEAEIAYWRRRVVESCIYGVDLNPLAVELAKLSLWLTTIATDQPLNFLDHHLRCGNSLVGARLDQLGHLPDGKRGAVVDDRQLRLGFGPDFAHALGATIRQIQKIESESSRDVAIVKDKEKRWQTRILPRLAPYREVADLWVDTFFGQPLTEEEYFAKAREILPTVELAEDTIQEPAARYRSRKPVKTHFHWELEFPEVFFREDGTPRGNPGFDAVVGNPPYVDIKALDEPMVRYLFRVYSASHQRVNIFAGFLERELQILRAGNAYVGAIIPSSFLTQVSYAALRQQVLQQCWLSAAVRLPNEQFGGTAGDVKVDTCIIIVQKQQPAAGSTTRGLVYQGFARITEICSSTASTVLSVPQSRWLAREGAVITLGDDSCDELLARMRRSSALLEDLCEFCLGLTPYDKYVGHTPEQIVGKVFHAKAQEDQTCRKLLLSGDVKRFAVEWNGQEWIRYGDWLAAPRQERFFTEERVLVQQIIDWTSLRIQAGWTVEALFNTQNQFSLLARPGTDLRYILAVLNSKLMSFYHRRVFLDVGRQRFQKILIKDAKTFPIPRVRFTTATAKRQRLAAAGQRLCADAVANGPDGPALEFVDAELAADRTDVVHDLLASLAEGMIEMNREKRATAKQFLTDLMDFHGIAAHSLKPKTRLNEFWALEASDLFAHLKANARILAAAGVRLNESDEDKIRTRFQSARERLVPLEARIAPTDRLIDQVVYRLYGLTEDEVRLVEAPGRT